MSIILSVASNIFAQCNQNDVDEMRTIYSKVYEASYKTATDQEKWMATIFTSVVEHALKSTKGLRGSWEHSGGFKVTLEGLTKFLLTVICLH